MSEESAVLKIVIQDEGQAGGAGGGGASGLEPPSAPRPSPRERFGGQVEQQPEPFGASGRTSPNRPEDDDKVRAYVPKSERDVWRKMLGEAFGDDKGESGDEASGGGASGGGGVRRRVEANAPQGEQPFDAAAVARKRLDREKQLEEVEAEYQKLNPTPPDAAFDPVKVAQDRLDKEKQLQAIEAEYARMKSPEAEKPFDAKAEAQKRFDAEQRKEQVEAEYRKVNPPKPDALFDATAVARERIEKERQEAMISEEVQALKKQGGVEGVLNRAMGKYLKGVQPPSGPSGAITAGGLGAAAGGFAGMAVAAQVTPEGTHRLASALEYEGLLGVASAAASNILENIPVISTILGGLGANFEAFAQKLKSTNEISVAVLSGDQKRGEILQNRERIRQMRESLGDSARLNPEFKKLVQDTIEKETSVARQQVISARAANVAKFSPEISTSQAKNQVENQRLGIAEAKFAGKDYAEFINSQGTRQRNEQVIGLLQEMKNMRGEIANNNSAIAKQNEQISELHKQNAARIDADIEDRKRAAKTDEERLKLEQERSRRQEELSNLVKREGKSSLADLIREMKPPGEDTAETKERDAIRDAQRKWQLGMGAFDF